VLDIYITRKVRFYGGVILTANKSEILTPHRICIDFNLNDSYPTQWGKNCLC
jgi:hypothetical protein